MQIQSKLILVVKDILRPDKPPPTENYYIYLFAAISMDECHA